MEDKSKCPSPWPEQVRSSFGGIDIFLESSDDVSRRNIVADDEHGSVTWPRLADANLLTSFPDDLSEMTDRLQVCEQRETKGAFGESANESKKDKTR